MARDPLVFSVPLLLALVGVAGSAPSPPSGIPAGVDLADLNGFNGFRAEGLDALGYAGISVASAGDINGDRIADLIIGAYAADPGGDDRAGSTYVVFGRKTTPAVPFPAFINLGLLDGTAGFRIDGIDEYDRSGRSVASAGDFNGDTIGDLIIGAPYADPDGNSNAGETYIIFGRKATPADPFPVSIDLVTLGGANGFRFDGINANSHSGRSVASAGDFNADKISDVIIGAPDANSSRGETYIVFGRKAAPADPFPASFDLSTLDGTNGFRIDGIDPGDSSGRCVAAAGDVNGDRISDIIIGAYGADPGGNSRAGETYVVFGRKATRADPFPASFDLSTLDGTNGFRIDGIDPEDESGFSVASAGDVNGDAIGDLIIGTPFADVGGNSDAGRTYIVFGRKAARANPFPASINLSTLDGTNGFRIDGIDPSDYSGWSVALAGDVNGDKISDVIIGAPDADPPGDSRGGETYVVFGRKATPDNPFPASIDLGALDGTNGFRLRGIDAVDLSGFCVASAGDFNADGRADFIIGAPGADPRGDSAAGEAYIILGPSPDAQVIFDGLTSLEETVLEDGGTLNLDTPLTTGHAVALHFNINNLGLADLSVTKLKTPKGFTVTEPPDAVVVALSSTSFTIQTTPTRTGTFSGKASFTTNDADEKKFDFTMTWTVVDTLASQAPDTVVIDVDSLPDLNNDWITNIADVVVMLRAISDNDPACDLNDDDQVNTDDLILLLNAFGAAQ